MPQKEYRLICEMAARAQFEERFTLTQLVMEALDQQAAAFEKVDVRTVMLHQNLIQLKRFFQEQTCVDSMKEFLAERRKALDAKWKAELLSERERCQEEEQIGILEEYFLQICEAHVTDCQEGFQLIRQLFEKNVSCGAGNWSARKLCWRGALPFWKTALEKDRSCCFWRPGLPGIRAPVLLFPNMDAMLISGTAGFCFTRSRRMPCGKNAGRFWIPCRNDGCGNFSQRL